jgi:hypothetical protein
VAADAEKGAPRKMRVASAIFVLLKIVGFPIGCEGFQRQIYRTLFIGDADGMASRGLILKEIAKRQAYSWQPDGQRLIPYHVLMSAN